MLGFESEYTKKNETKALFSHGFSYICDTKTIVIMKRVCFILMIMILTVVSSCQMQPSEAIYNSGVSKELAEWRKATIEDLHYRLHFIIPEQRTEAIEATTEIIFSLKRSQPIVIDFRDTELLSIVTDSEGNAISYSAKNEHIVIPKEATAAGENRFTLHFTAGNQSLNRNNEFLYTLLVPDRARTLFPCFDQPDLKASFELSLTIPGTWVAVSNREVIEERTEGNTKHLRFSPTEPLSTYLFSFVAGKLEHRTYDDGDHRFTAYFRDSDPKRIAQLEEIFKQVKASLVWLEEYTDISYPFAKYDFIMLPGFQYGGMEHTGATLYNDRQMFLGENPTPDEILRRSQLIAHETAHMWFGDFVTMKWFDDVWTKEVFANYFAARMVEPLYPTINHQLNRLKTYTTAALNEDRTLGATSIRQELDNLQNAGLIYGQTIYNKAPIVMDKMVEIMGEEPFRKGIQEYLTTYAYGNATWPELIEILDRYTPEDLASFSDTWVHTKGMARIDFVLNDNNLTITQHDTFERGVCWTQRFDCLLILENGNTQEVEVELRDESHTIALSEGVVAVLPNSDGRGYGLFVPDAKSIEWIESNINKIEDDITRQSLIMTLNECYEWGLLEGERWLRFMLGHLPKEKNYLIASTIVGYLTKPMINSGTEAEEALLWEIATLNDSSALRRRALVALAEVATSERIIEQIYNLWLNDGASFDVNDAMTIALELAIRMPDKQAEIIAEQRQRITNGDNLRKFDYISPATTPDIEARNALFAWLLEPENRRTEPWAKATLALLNHHTRQQEALAYIYPGLEELKRVQRTGDIFFPRNWAGGLLGGHYSAEAVAEVERFLANNPDYPTLLKNKILQATHH